MKQLKTPNGDLIIGTLESILGNAYVSGFVINDAGVLEPEYDGETDVYWDSQTSVLRNGEVVYLDDEGNEFTLDQLTVIDESEPPAVAGG